MLDLHQYAMLRAELEASPDARDAVLARYGFEGARWQAIDIAWRSRLSRHPHENASFEAEKSLLLASWRR